jgi:ABC-type dipeptide/oligopeptide/nickel transport system ATPase component
MYRILSCQLNLFKRMLLNNIRSITLTPESAVQLILGTNGCGKSSLLEQLSPLPANPSEFESGGSKIVRIEKGNKEYVCSSFINGGKGHHSFTIDGTEHNPGGTATVQLQLCKEHFSVTPDTHDLIRGFIKFTSMSAADRREWFTVMCDEDYTFAMNAYDQLKKRANQLGGAATMNKKNLVVETAKLLSLAEEEKLEREVQELLSELTVMQAEREPLGISSETHMANRTNTLKQLEATAMRIIRTNLVAPFEYRDGKMERDDWGQLIRARFTSIQEIDNEIDKLKHIATSREAIMATLGGEFNKLAHKYEILVKTGAEGVLSLREQIGQLTEEIHTKLKHNMLGLVFPQARVAFDAYLSIDQALTEKVRTLPENADRRLGRNRYQTLLAEKNVLTDQIKAGHQQYQRQCALKEHAELHRGENKQSCPKCNHQWTTGVNEEEFAKLKTALYHLEDANAKLAAQMAVLDTELAEIEKYFDHYRDITGYMKNVVVLKPFWDFLLEKQSLMDSPLEAVKFIRQLKEDLAVAVDVEELELKKAELMKLRAEAEEVGDANLDEVRTQLAEMEARLGKLANETANVNRSINEYSDYRRQLNQNLVLAEEVKQLYRCAEDNQDELVAAIRRESIHNCIVQIENALALKQESLRSAKMQRAIVENLRKMVETYEVQEVAAKALVRTISPTHGLIAEGLLGFINNFVGQMNAFIDRIWTYPLRVIPTGYKSTDEEQTAELDYKFKMVVERESNIVPEVKFGSDGIKEVVDLAFKIVAMRQLGLEDTPLLLDEFGRAFDEEHRLAAVREITWMMENDNYPQLFMISHYVASYSAFVNADICVIDDRNIVIPAGRPFNRNVEIVN